MITRKEYLDGDATHQEYYAQFVTDTMLTHFNSGTTEEEKRVFIMHRDKNTPESKHLSFYDIRWWDRFGYWKSIREDMEKVGDFPTLANLVCLWKEVARQWLKQN